MTPRDYARLHWKWYEDPVLCACAAQEPAALHLWPVLIAMSAHASHHEDNPQGVFTTSAVQLSRIVGVDAGVVDTALALLEEGELVSLEGGLLGSVVVTLTKFSEWQVARGSDAKRKSDSRDRIRASRENVSDGHAEVTDASRSRHPEEKREEEKREEKEGARERTLPPTVVETLGLVRQIPGLSPWQLESNVRKAMQQFPSLTDTAICEAITAFETKIPEGQAIRSDKAWRLMHACFRVAGQKATEHAAVSILDADARLIAMRADMAKHRHLLEQSGAA